MGGINFGEGSLKVKDALQGSQRPVKDAGPHLEGMALQPTLGNEAVASGAGESGEVANRDLGG